MRGALRCTQSAANERGRQGVASINARKRARAKGPDDVLDAREDGVVLPRVAGLQGHAHHSTQHACPCVLLRASCMITDAQPVSSGHAVAA